MSAALPPYLEYEKVEDGRLIDLSLPTHWKHLALKRMLSFGNGKDHKNIEVYEGGFPVYGSGGPFAQASEYLHDGESVLFGRKGTIDRPLYLNCRFWTVDTMYFTRISSDVCARYIYYAALGIPYSLYSTNTALPSMTQEVLGNHKTSAPPLEEQTQIAKFLDYETAKIDALIEKQQQLIALLKEKRQAVISHAVTKGLNPDALMRDSGVEWLGEVPAHWEVSKFGFVSSVVRGGSPRPAGDPTLFNGDYSPWVTVAEITKDDEITLTETATFLTRKGSIQCRVFTSGTLLLSNSGATLGVPKVLMIDANANDGVVGFEDLKHHREYCYYYLSSLTEDLRERIKQGSGQPNLNTDIVKAIPVPIPPPDETGAIVRHMSELREKFKQLAEKAELAVELLLERRTALISAAVTGKIDVRGWTAPESETITEVAS